MLKRIIIGSIITTGAVALFTEEQLDKFRDEKLQREIDALCEGNGGIIKRSFESDEVSNEVAYEVFHCSDYEMGIKHYSRNVKLAKLLHPSHNIVMDMQCLGPIDPKWSEQLKCDITIKVSHKS